MNFVEKHKEKLFSCINELEKDRGDYEEKSVNNNLL